MRHNPSVLGQVSLPGTDHTVTIKRIPDTNDTGYLAHAECTCKWLSIDAMPALSDIKGRAHLRSHVADPS